jgi:hypothetical protein
MICSATSEKSHQRIFEMFNQCPLCRRKRTSVTSSAPPPFSVKELDAGDIV